jgi:hypothetical protein
MSSEPDEKRGDARLAGPILTLVEEELLVTKREVVTGRVRVRTVTDTRENGPTGIHNSPPRIFADSARQKGHVSRRYFHRCRN